MVKDYKPTNLHLLTDEDLTVLEDVYFRLSVMIPAILKARKLEQDGYTTEAAEIHKSIEVSRNKLPPWANW